MRPDPRPARNAGFTLIEVLVVLAIMAVIVTMVATRGPAHSQGLELREATRELALAMRRAQARAITTDRDVAIALDPTGTGYVLDGTERHALPQGARLGMAAALPRPHAIASIVFAPDGSASGGIATMISGTLRTRIDVNWLTGRARIVDAS